MSKSIVAIATLALFVTACEQGAGDDEAKPYASRYQPMAGGATLLTGATVLTGTGERLDGADVLFKDGKIQAVGENLDAGDAKRHQACPGLNVVGYAAFHGTPLIVSRF